MKATQLPNRIIVLGKDMPHKAKVAVEFNSVNIALFEQFVADNQDEYTLENYTVYWYALRQFSFDIAAFFNKADSGQTMDIRTKFYKQIVYPYEKVISKNFD